MHGTDSSELSVRVYKSMRLLSRNIEGFFLALQNTLDAFHQRCMSASTPSRDMQAML